LELLQQDNAQHLRDHPDEADDPSLSEDPIFTSQGRIVVPDDDENISPGKGVEEAKAERIMPKRSESASPGEVEREQPLVAYWHWEHSLRSQKMKLHLAKGADLALHVVMAIIVNQVRYERNAIAMTI